MQTGSELSSLEEESFHVLNIDLKTYQRVRFWFRDGRWCFQRVLRTRSEGTCGPRYQHVVKPHNLQRPGHTEQGVSVELVIHSEGNRRVCEADWRHKVL